MNTRERFNKVLAFERCDRGLIYEHFWPWALTIDKWYEQGMKQSCWEYGRYDMYTHFDWENFWDTRAPVDFGLSPSFEYKVLEEDDEHITYINTLGAKVKERKDSAAIPHVLENVVKTPEDWERLKERLNPKEDGRYPANWDEFAGWSKTTVDFPPCIHGYPFGIFGFPRELLGTEEFLVAFYTMPDLIHDMMNYLVDFWIDAAKRGVSEAKLDFVLIWEDMAGKQGSLISPAMFREFMLEPYKRLCGFYKDCGIKNIIVDTDGNCTELIPLFMESGVTGLLPFEVQAGMDVREVRKAFPALQIIGGLDKRALAKDKKAIDEELESKIPYMLKYGGYLPCLDHTVPPDVPFENFKYYMKRLAEIIKDFGYTPT